ncbi:PaREP1 family protein [Vulcanisaeta distributa]|uniref:PaREP1 family protein n=1 Tax=Vulcanisaeta distributa (strain DSM 14429 / JCM 11212 / NBRC 100878 / IC-017) TaxID=572478 RepID=E1QTF9_VULDI|nr:PaREP1 family protein [Vulcanisaeta distributa]ADN50952.1 PaREP1 family protein [Vulcanisaeta distributa DSM 14429]
MIEIKLNLDEIGKSRLMEAQVELELAEKFLNDGLLRNAAGKAFQAWKSYLSYLAIKSRHLFNFTGYKRVSRSVKVSRNDWILAIMPTNMLMEIASKLAEKNADIVELTSLALVIHEYQYNGPDPTGIVSKLPSDEAARQVLAKFIARAKELIKQARETQ